MAVTDTPVRLTAPTALTGTEATLYTAPTGTGLTAVIRNIHVANTAGTDRQITLATGLVATAANAAFWNLVVPANDAFSLEVLIGLNSAETFRGICTLSGGVTIQLMGAT